MVCKLFFSKNHDYFVKKRIPGLRASAFGVLCTFKTEKSRPLEGQVSPVPFHQIAELAAGNMQLQAVTALKLEGDVVGGGAVAVVNVSAIVMVGGMSPFRDHHRRNRQPGRLVVLMPLGNDPKQDNTKNHKNSNRDHRGK